jgi:hypothetical protein
MDYIALYHNIEAFKTTVVRTSSPASRLAFSVIYSLKIFLITVAYPPNSSLLTCIWTLHYNRFVSFLVMFSSRCRIWPSRGLMGVSARVVHKVKLCNYRQCFLTFWPVFSSYTFLFILTSLLFSFSLRGFPTFVNVKSWTKNRSRLSSVRLVHQASVLPCL